MLTISPEAERGLVEARKHCDKLDQVLFHRGAMPRLRVDFENRLDYLRLFGCVTNSEENEVDINLVEVRLCWEGDLTFFWSATRAGQTDSWMCGGLNWHGPKLGETISLDTPVEHWHGWSVNT